MPIDIALIGGGEFRAECVDMDNHILSLIPLKPPRILIVPTAAALENPYQAAANGINYFSSLGAIANQLMIVDREQADESSLVDSVNAASLVYFTGGNPHYLIKTVQGSKLHKAIVRALKTGSTLVGSSAGAMMMGSILRLPSGKWIHGLGIATGIAVLPHHERRDPEEVLRLLQKEMVSANVWVLGIDTATCCLRISGNWVVQGRGTVTLYHGGRWKRFGPGETIHNTSEYDRL